MKKSDEAPHVTFKEAARILRSSPHRLRVGHAAGQFQAILIGKRWAIPRDEIERLLNAQGQSER